MAKKNRQFEDIELTTDIPPAPPKSDFTDESPESALSALFNRIEQQSPAPMFTPLATPVYVGTATVPTPQPVISDEVRTRAELHTRMKIAEEQSLPSESDRYRQIHCTQCNGIMWTRNPLKEDTCEDCGYQLRVEYAEQQVEAFKRQRVVVNPFR